MPPPPRWLLEALRSAMVKGCREPPYPSVLTDATMEKLALTKFISQEAHCEVGPTPGGTLPREGNRWFSRR